MITRFTLIFSCALLISGNIFSQRLDGIIKNQQGYTRQLSITRGIEVNEWQEGDVTEENLFNVLKSYKRPMGLMIYDYVGDSLSITLLDNFFEDVLQEKIYLPKDSLSALIADTNWLFANHSISRAPGKRGMTLLKENSDSLKLAKAYSSLSEILLPFEQIIPLQHLIIVPTLSIGTVPFAALKFPDGHYLIESLSYSIAPSLSEVVALKGKNADREVKGEDEISYHFSNALFVANPVFPESTEWSFPSLPGSQKEMELITANMDSSDFQLLTQNEASVENFQQEICDYDLLYFATHGVSSPDSALDKSFLLFAGDGLEAAFYTAREIQSIRDDCSLNASLVILSACQTGLGQEHEGGIIGLSRAFQLAGANHVVMSLWNISDNETGKLMGFFMENLQQSSYLQPHEALRKAMVKYKNEVNDNPNLWASFSIFGIPF